MELLSPAGDLQKAYIAFRYGADAIYCGLPMFSLRTRENNFSEKEIEEIVNFAHKNHKKVYITINGFPHQDAIFAIKKHLYFLKKIVPHGIIVADAGVLDLANEIIPKIPKHLSVQATTLNEPAINFWKKNGVSRVILAREISLNEIKKIHKLAPDIELEYFVHGSMCMAYSGRCLISSYMTGRDANKGTCAHCCRWNYKIYEENFFLNQCSKFGARQRAEQVDTEKNIHQFEKKIFLEEEQRKGEFFEMEEDFHGTHLMSSRDMCMIEFLDEIKSSGVFSIKIEGRNKTPYYLAIITRVYKKALNDLVKEKKFDKNLWKEIYSVANRGFFAGFLHGMPRIEGQQYQANISRSTHDFIGITKNYEDKKIRFEVKNRLFVGDKIEFIFPDHKDDFSFVVKKLEQDEQNVDVLHGGSGDGFIFCEKKIPEGIFIRKLKKIFY